MTIVVMIYVQWKDMVNHTVLIMLYLKVLQIYISDCHGHVMCQPINSQAIIFIHDIAASDKLGNTTFMKSSALLGFWQVSANL